VREYCKVFELKVGMLVKKEAEDERLNWREEE